MAEGEAVYCTLILNDGYLPGASVLAHSLRDCGSTRKLACLVTVDTISVTTLDELRSLYNYVIPVSRIGNPNPGNLYLMNRPDLLYAFTKIQLWRQTQFRKIVYLDADVVALRSPEELFDIEDDFAAAPDIGWPDAFNTGVMVLTPSDGEYRALHNMATAGDSFDGADQGLLNQYFENKPWKRLSFTYNCTPSASYQYEPAYRYHKSGISLVHFIGPQKPWAGHRVQDTSAGVYQELLSRWWAVYDRHHDVAPHLLARNTALTSDRVPQATSESHASVGYPPELAAQSSTSTVEVPITESKGPATGLQTSSRDEQQQADFEAPRAEWDATRAPPPIQSRPEASNFPAQIYEFNADPKPFQPPSRYPEPPKNMWFEVPPKATSKPAALPAIFPWEEREMPKPSRRFIEDETPTAADNDDSESSLEGQLDVGEFEVESESNATSTTSPSIRVSEAASFEAFGPSSKNAWDEVSGIESYVRALTSRQKSRGQVQVLRADQLSPGAQPSPVKDIDIDTLFDKVQERRESLILTDFPSAVERPSLPVTPAPRRRSTFWGQDNDDESNLPPAEGVPDQVDWNPAEQLEQLRRTSLLGPEHFKLQEVKAIPRRASVPSAATLSDLGPEPLSSINQEP